MFSKGKKTTKEIALRLQEVRKQTALSSAEMALRLGVSTGCYAKNEGGLHIPNLDSLRRLTMDFDISMDWFLFGKGPRLYKEKSEREKELEKTVEEMTRSSEALRNEITDLNREIADLKKQSEEEHKKIAREKAGALEMIPEVRELLDFMAQDPIFYHRLLLYFQEFKQQKKIPAELTS